MTQTPNIGLKKIDGSENWRNVFDYHNDSMDLADEAIAGVRAGLTYVENGDTIAANANYTAGKFIAWKGEIYRVKATINATVTSANWTTYLDKMDGMGGALSQINEDLTSLNSKIATTPVTTVGKVEYWKSGNIVTVYINGAQSGTTLTTLATLPVGYRPPIYIRSRGQTGAYGNDNVQVHISNNGEVKIESSSATSLAYALVSYVV